MAPTTVIYNHQPLNFLCISNSLYFLLFWNFYYIHFRQCFVCFCILNKKLGFETSIFKSIEVSLCVWHFIFGEYLSAYLTTSPIYTLVWKLGLSLFAEMWNMLQECAMVNVLQKAKRSNFCHCIDGDRNIHFLAGKFSVPKSWKNCD